MFTYSPMLTLKISLRTTLITLLLVWSSGRGQDNAAPPADLGQEEQAGPAGFEIRVDADPPKATVGDYITLQYLFLVPEGHKIRLPSVAATSGEFTIIESFPADALPVGPGESPDQQAEPKVPADKSGVRSTASMVVTLYKLGEFQFPALQFALIDASGQEMMVESPPVTIQIESVLTEADSELKHLKTQAEIVEPVSWLLWTAVGILALILVALAWWLWQRGRRREELPSPRQPGLDAFAAAKAEIRDLLGRGLLEKGFVKQFYVALSEIVRKLLEAGYEIQTLEKTTDEIMESLRRGRDDSDPGGEFTIIEQLLLEFDLVKFAKYIPNQSSNERAVQGAYQILTWGKQRRDQRAVAKEAESKTETTHVT